MVNYSESKATTIVITILIKNSIKAYNNGNQNTAIIIDHTLSPRVVEMEGKPVDLHLCPGPIMGPGLNGS